MHDAGKIIPGMIAFVLFVTIPFWANFGKAAPEPKPELPKEYKKCVESKDFMRREHMKLLRKWRFDVVRNNMRVYINSEGQTFDMSLQNECMRCHTQKKKFCDVCHDYVAAHPYCWNCHIPPEEKKGWATKETENLTEEVSSKQPASHH
ncbi:MAG: cytochrome C [Thermodesulfobacteria bacterium]|nr:cytochrome C [Thermodesulfobacteriota bacterium]